MAIGTPDDALPYLGFNYTPTHSPIDHLGNLSLFLSGNVVKIQDHWICLTTINTRMLALVLPKIPP